ncbi:hypothetical protein BdWA1_000124 [Babesia duncani]|uniref:Uncharacterized protein n=1 Tax=Babesia duncani TaxID=323732 RepID=A0AAD9UPT5_9APIC|nr:hypothetical protein BdWA1_000124 [Babesia duncani]
MNLSILVAFFPLYIYIHFDFAFGGLCSLPFKSSIQKGCRATRHFFYTPGYRRLVRSQNYVHAATFDDVTKGKYLFLDLLSREHHPLIEVSKESSGTNGHTTEVVSYSLDSSKAPKEFPKLTIGCVYWYKQKLQCSLNYAKRTVKTYRDSMNRFCVRIESFDDNGTRRSLRIFREKNSGWWWLKVITDEKVTLLDDTLNKITSWFSWGRGSAVSDSSVASRDFDVVLMDPGYDFVRHETSELWVAYNKVPGKGACGIANLLFRTRPLALPRNLVDLYIWRFFKGSDSNHITWVVVAAVTNGSVDLNYYKCLDHEQRQYQPMDSFAEPSNSILKEPFEMEQQLLSNPNPQTVSVNMKIPTDVGLDVLPGILIHAFADSDHLVLRPASPIDYQLVTTFSAIDSAGQLHLFFPTVDMWSYLALESIPNQHKQAVSLCVFNNQGPDFGGSFLMHKDSERLLHFFDIHTVSHLSRMRSPWFHSFNFLKQPPKLQATRVNLDIPTTEIIVGMHRGYSFIMVNLVEPRVLDALEGPGGALLSITPFLNTQIVYIEDDDGKDTAIVMARDDISIYQLIGDNFQIVEKELVTRLLSDYNLEHLNKKILPVLDETEINLNRKVQAPDVYVLPLSADAALYYTREGTRIVRIVFNEHQLLIKEGEAHVLHITRGPIQLILVDVALGNSSITRECYKLDKKAGPLLISAISIEYSDIMDLRRKLDDSWYDLIQEPLILYADFNDVRLARAYFDYSKMSILHSDYTGPLGIGVYECNGRLLGFPKGAKWRQVMIDEGAVPPIHSVFTLSKDGISEHDCIPGANSSGHMAPKMTPFTNIKSQFPTGNSLVCIADVVCNQPGLKQTMEKDTIEYKPSGKATPNIIVFGVHEFVLESSVKVTRVLFKAGNEPQVSIETASHGTLVYKSATVLGGIESHALLYELISGDGSIAMDVMAPIREYKEQCVAQDVLNFNTGQLPIHVRYLTLNSSYMYYTGIIKSEDSGVTLIFGNQELKLKGLGTSYHIWIRYPTETISTALLFIHHQTQKCEERQFHSLEDVMEASLLTKPALNYNWGVLSHAESHIINAQLVKMATKTTEMKPIDLYLDDNELSSGILKVELDEHTLMYTTRATCEIGIGSVFINGCALHGPEKALASQVFHSLAENEQVVIIVGRTPSDLVLGSFKLTRNNKFNLVDLSEIDFNLHPGLSFLVQV